MVDAVPSTHDENLNQSDKLRDIVSAYQSYIDEQDAINKTFTFWASYIRIVQPLLSFIRAVREATHFCHSSDLTTVLCVTMLLWLPLFSVLVSLLGLRW